MTNSETLEFSPTSTNDEEEERSNIFSTLLQSYVKLLFPLGRLAFIKDNQET